MGAFFRLAHIDKSFWIDEILSYERSVQPFSSMMSQNAYPLSYTLIHFALKLGDTEAILRLPSFLAGIAGVWLIYFLGRACHSRRVGLVASFLLALNSAHIYYSQDGRFYSLMPLGVIVCLWTLTRAIQSPRPLKYWLGFSVGVSIGSLTHPFFLPFIASAGIGAVVALFLRPAKYGNRLHAFGMLCVFGALGLLPLGLLYINLEKVPVAQLVNTGQEGNGHYLLSLERYWYYLHWMLRHQSPETAFPAVLLTLAGGCVLSLRRKWKVMPLLLAPLLMPVPFFFIPVSHWYTEKYFIAVLPCLLVCLAVIFVEAGRGVGYLLYQARKRVKSDDIITRWSRSGLVSTFTIVVLVEMFAAEYYARNLYDNHLIPNWKAFAEDMGSHMTGDDVIVHFAPLHLNPYTQNRTAYEPVEYTFNWYLQRQVPPGRGDLYPTQHLLTASQAELDSWLRKYPDRTFWLVHYHSLPPVPLSDAQARLFEQRLPGRGNSLFVAGAPTKNLIKVGDFETTPALRSQIGNVAIVNKGTAAEPDNCLRMTANSVLPAVVEFAVSSDSASSGSQVLAGNEYVLSMQMKYENVQGDVLSSGSLVVLVTGTVGGRQIEVPLQTFQGSDGWHFQSFSFSRKTISELFGASSVAIRVSLDGGAGSALIDEVQLEIGVHPTPYVNGARLNHINEFAAHDGSI